MVPNMLNSFLGSPLPSMWRGFGSWGCLDPWIDRFCIVLWYGQVCKEGWRLPLLTPRRHAACGANKDSSEYSPSIHIGALANGIVYNTHLASLNTEADVTQAIDERHIIIVA